MITLVAVVCTVTLGVSGDNLKPVDLCEDVVIPTESMVAGKASDPIPMPYTMVACAAGGVKQAQDWINQQQQYKGWHITKVMCVPGKYESRGRA